MRLLLEPGSERLCWTHPSTGRPDARFALDVAADVLGVVLTPRKPKMRRRGIWGRVGEGLGADGEFLPLLVGHGLRGAREAAVFDGRQDADFIREVRGLRKQNTCQSSRLVRSGRKPARSMRKQRVGGVAHGAVPTHSVSDHGGARRRADQRRHFHPLSATPASVRVPKRF